MSPDSILNVFQRWHDPPSAPSGHPSPSPRSPASRQASPSEELPTSQNPRTAFILDRFSANCTIGHYSNHLLIAREAATSRPFFDFVAREDEALVRSWLGAIKTCGVNDSGQPSSGGFGYGRFV